MRSTRSSSSATFHHGGGDRTKSVRVAVSAHAICRLCANASPASSSVWFNAVITGFEASPFGEYVSR